VLTQALVVGSKQAGIRKGVKTPLPLHLFFKHCRGAGHRLQDAERDPCLEGVEDSIVRIAHLLQQEIDQIQQEGLAFRNISLQHPRLSILGTMLGQPAVDEVSPSLHPCLREGILLDAHTEPT
jgi:hypothetical protein